MAMTEIFGTTAAMLSVCMFGLWLASAFLRNASIVDVFWGIGFVLVAASGFFWGHASIAPRSLLISAMVALWGLRLGGHLLLRNAGHGEDPRYAAMRRHWGARFWWVSFFTVFALQGVILWFVSLPVQVVQAAPGGPLGGLDAVGAAVWFVGLVFETVGDHQLARFKSDPANAGAVMDRGLWRYTRHPNYFGDFCIWWGVFIVALSAPQGLYTIASPALMAFLLLRVSGVPLLERGMSERRPGYADYIRRTSPFFPRPPRQTR
jgi:steroid 5-alpha reductase family enzyme